MNNKLIKGTLVGIIAPVATFFVYVAFFSKIQSPKLMLLKIIELDRLSHVISLCLLINLLIFFMNIKTYRDEEARGIIFATILYGVFIVSLKIF
ncbi:hypothetical protein OAQ21_04230 [Flavobacteriales bacterium]|nr:hypothetical protein [Flavobacteriales bacterium]